MPRITAYAARGEVYHDVESMRYSPGRSRCACRSERRRRGFGHEQRQDQHCDVFPLSRVGRDGFLFPLLFLPVLLQDSMLRETVLGKRSFQSTLHGGSHMIT